VVDNSGDRAALAGRAGELLAQLGRMRRASMRALAAGLADAGYAPARLGHGGPAGAAR